jgi:phage tail protein X
MAVYLTKANDMLDAICFQYYGESRDYTEVVREANPDLTSLGPLLPAGIQIELPSLDDVMIQPDTIRLWD